MGTYLFNSTPLPIDSDYVGACKALIALDLLVSLTLDALAGDSGALGVVPAARCIFVETSGEHRRLTEILGNCGEREVSR